MGREREGRECEYKYTCIHHSFFQSTHKEYCSLSFLAKNQFEMEDFRIPTHPPSPFSPLPLIYPLYSSHQPLFFLCNILLLIIHNHKQQSRPKYLDIVSSEVWLHTLIGICSLVELEMIREDGGVDGIYVRIQGIGQVNEKRMEGAREGGSKYK